MLVGKPVTIARVRGEIVQSREGEKLLVTIHPSALLRIPAREDRHAEYRRFVHDLRLCKDYV